MGVLVGGLWSKGLLFGLGLVGCGVGGWLAIRVCCLLCGRVRCFGVVWVWLVVVCCLLVVGVWFGWPAWTFPLWVCCLFCGVWVVG